MRGNYAILHPVCFFLTTQMLFTSCRTFIYRYTFCHKICEHYSRSHSLLYCSRCCCCSKIKVACMCKLYCIVKLHHERFNFARWVVIFHHTFYHKALVCTIFIPYRQVLKSIDDNLFSVLCCMVFVEDDFIYLLNIPSLSFFV